MVGEGLHLGTQGGEDVGGLLLVGQVSDHIRFAVDSRLHEHHVGVLVHVVDDQAQGDEAETEVQNELLQHGYFKATNYPEST